MNADKTQLVWLGTRQQLAKLTTTELPLLSALVKPSSAVIDFGVNIDGHLTMADHVAAQRRSCLFQLPVRQLRVVRSSLTLEAAKTLVACVGSDCLLQHRATSDCKNNYNDATASTALSEERAKTHLTVMRGKRVQTHTSPYFPTAIMFHVKHVTQHASKLSVYEYE